MDKPACRQHWPGVGTPLTPFSGLPPSCCGATGPGPPGRWEALGSRAQSVCPPAGYPESSWDTGERWRLPLVQRSVGHPGGYVLAHPRAVQPAGSLQRGGDPGQMRCWRVVCCSQLGSKLSTLEQTWSVSVPGLRAEGGVPKGWETWTSVSLSASCDEVWCGGPWAHGGWARAGVKGRGQTAGGPWSPCTGDAGARSLHSTRPVFSEAAGEAAKLGATGPDHGLEHQVSRGAGASVSPCALCALAPSPAAEALVAEEASALPA